MAVTGVCVDDDGIRAQSDAEVVLDVLFDGRRIWSFHLHRDGTRRGSTYAVPWPSALRRFLNGTTQLTVAEHVGGHVAFDEELHLGDGDERIAVVNDRGLPLGIDKSLRLAQTFDTRSAEHVAPLLDSIEEVLGALKKAGIDAFPAYGTLLGAVRAGELIGHDSDADLGYVSEHSHPADVVLESFRLQRALTDMGYRISRYSGIAFKVDVVEADGSVRGLDVFGGFLNDGYLYLMGEIRTPFRRDWIFPLGTTTLEGRELPAPADTDRFLTATYGPSWRVPDPAYKFETPQSTHRRLNGWFRGTRVAREAWDRAYSRRLDEPVDLTPSDFARWVAEQEGGALDRVVDLGCGRGIDDLWLARQGARAVGLDYALRGSEQVAAIAEDEDVDLEFRHLNLCELRSVLAQAARLARDPGRTVVTVRHVAEATDRPSRERMWRACEMLLRGGGRLYVEVLVGRGKGDPFARREHLRTLPLRLVVQELKARGARVV
ncbi:MAG: methyltransferase domain-containing protein, partial [Nocardioidaceae bacterium]|nr:methyltransferase domain-containing protein [Nocardioidaceae bacterium]